MSLLNNNSKKGEKGAKKPRPNVQGSKFILKPAKGGTNSQKPHKAGGARGS